MLDLKPTLGTLKSDFQDRFTDFRAVSTVNNFVLNPFEEDPIKVSQLAVDSRITKKWI